MKSTKVIVVGGGLAGLSAAYELSKRKKFEVHLIEASNYVGGRVCTKKIKGHPIDFGGFIIYPWYKHFHKLLKELDLEKKLSQVPNGEIYCDLTGNNIYELETSPSWASFMHLFVNSAFDFFNNLDVTDPNLKKFKNLTTKEYMEKKLGKKNAKQWINKFDTISQGYCYGPADKYKAVFGLPIAAKIILHGGLETAQLFKKGTSLVTNALASAIKKNGGTIHLGTYVTDVKKLSVKTTKGSMEADAFVFAQTVSNDLYKKIVPKIKIECSYSHFVTAALLFDHQPVINGQFNWGATFHKPRKKDKIQILSTINLSRLYPKDLKGYLTVNAIIRDNSIKNLTEKKIFNLLKKDIHNIFPDAKCKEIVQFRHWEKTMPIAQENFVRCIKEAQGKNKYYFAGDYIGMPSMETAVASGVRAVEHLIKDFT